MRTYKIHFSLFIKAEKYHYSELVENCQCGECPSYIKKSDLYFMEEQVNKYNRKHKVNLTSADDKKTYLPVGNYKLLWNDKQISTLKIE